MTVLIPSRFGVGFGGWAEDAPVEVILRRRIDPPAVERRGPAVRAIFIYEARNSLTSVEQPQVHVGNRKKGDRFKATNADIDSLSAGHNTSVHI